MKLHLNQDFRRKSDQVGKGLMRKKELKMNTTPSRDDAAPSQHELQRKLSNRHLQLIAIGGCIGTGLFMGSGKTIALAGPSILLIYMIIGGMFFFLMRALVKCCCRICSTSLLLIWHMI